MTSSPRAAALCCGHVHRSAAARARRRARHRPRDRAVRSSPASRGRAGRGAWRRRSSTSSSTGSCAARSRPGATLPTEPLLCQTFGVSRTVVREAVKSLESMRLVRVQQGQGTTVRPLGDWDLFNPTVLSAVIRHDAELAILEDSSTCAARSRRRWPAGRAAGRRRAARGAHRADVRPRAGGGRPRALPARRHRLPRRDHAGLGQPARPRDDPHPADGGLPQPALRRRPERGRDEAVQRSPPRRPRRGLVGDADTAEDAMREHIIGSWHRRRPATDAHR